ncbi:MAG: tripartite tricarboxylate transporter TctB family protein, partial [Propionivibrio sp.]|nr:tripartite tricarboxylate transporter TctB family protein [Propionivibrio sp.]
LILVYIALMQFVGFPIMTVVYLVAQFTILTPAERKPNFLVYAVIAVLTSALVYLLFRYAFDMMLPVGFLDI